jgi:diaminopimelate epimerase
VKPLLSQAAVPVLATEFYKMSAGGNDFIAFDNRSGSIGVSVIGDLVKSVCTRALSVGADGVIFLEKSAEADVRARFFNPDGGPTFCGNGARCAARLAYLKGIAPARMKLQSDLMTHRAEVHGTFVSLEMRDPRGFDDAVEVALEGERVRGVFVDTGVPHFVVFRPMAPSQPIEPLGRALRAHARFGPAGANVNFVQPLPGGGLSIRTFERGVEAETLACGTGCVAAALAAGAAGKASPPVNLVTRSGESIRVRYEGDPRAARGVRLEGEARLVYVGQLTEEALRAFMPVR